MFVELVSFILQVFDHFCPYSISIWTKVTRVISRQASNVEATENEMLYGCGGTRLRRLNRVKSGEYVPFLLLYIFFSSLVSCSIEDNEGIKCGEGRLASRVL
ncbi:hypothetical protein Hanom_Chr13g01191041 [Helianthus anomalus]